MNTNGKKNILLDGLDQDPNSTVVKGNKFSATGSNY